VSLSFRLPSTLHSDSHDISSFFLLVAPQKCGPPNAIAPGAVDPCCRISDSSCDKRAHGHSRHEDVALDGSLYRVVWHGTPVSSHLYIYLFSSFYRTRLILMCGNYTRRVRRRCSLRDTDIRGHSCTSIVKSSPHRRCCGHPHPHLNHL